MLRSTLRFASYAQPTLRLSLTSRAYALKKGTPYFTKDHEWIVVGENNVGTVGITEFAQNALGDVVYVDVPEKGKAVKQKQTLAAVESVKAASDIYAPASGTVTEGNSALSNDPALINKSPLTDGWICKLTLSENGLKEVEALLDGAAYKKHCEESKH
eukprot:TRINITY_DN30111_c0_g1_i1.p1 TRINITY_DN30111_c0_g1~~TRINITY_DN30111_c0_g1_i1.p1  ORF type:complete len:165 (+),score=77.73 TRINITY_DN30111_c0_g1_i1:23-496(+)